MKVHLVNLSKRFGEQTLFAHLNLRFPEEGLIAVVGPSGCGKSTLLKIIAGLDRDFGGEVTLGNHSIRGSTVEENERFRLANIGFVFQDFNLLNLDRVEANVLLPYLPFHQQRKALQKRRLAEVLRSVGLAGFEKRYVQTLSGGEKQRVAIARALIHDPDLILADEPTGALDQANAQKILEILRKISQKILVIVVSHDETLVEQYADQIVRFEQTNIIEIKNLKSSDKTSSFFFPLYPKNALSRGIPWAWSIAHAQAHLKQKKWRTAISQMALGMSLLGVGLSLSLSQTISHRIEQTLTSMLGDPSIIMTPAEGSHVTPMVSGAPLSEVEHLKEQFPEAIQGVGVTYENNFEDMFRDANQVVISTRGTKNPLPSFTLRDFNDFTWLSDVTESILPFRPPKMEKDEIILGLTYADLTVLTGDLHTKNTLSALAQYLELQEVFLSLEVANLSWGYEDEQIFSLIGVYLTEHPRIIHADPFWNQWLFEEAMRFPITDHVSVLPELPWILQRVPFVHTQSDPSLLLDEALTNERFQAFVLDRFLTSDHPSLCGQQTVCTAPRLKVYLVEKNTIALGDVDFVRKIAPFLGHYVICSPRGYAMYPSAFMAGFSRPTYFCSNDALLDQVIDSVSVISAQEQATLLALPRGVLSGHFLATGEEAVKLHSMPKTTLVGRLPREKHEIAISEHMARKFFKSNKEAVGKPLFVGSSLNEVRDENATLRQTFGKASLTITGIVGGATSFIVQDDLWAITFFRDFLGVSSLDLLATSVAFSLNQKIDPSDLERLNRQFPTYSFQDPSYELSESLGETTQYISWVLVCLSCLGLVISALLLGLVLTLFMVENKKENELLETLGFEGRQRRRVAMTTLWVLDAQTWLFSCGELFVLNIGIGLYLDDIFNISGNLSVLPWPYLAMAGMTFFLTLVVGSFVTFSRKKEPSMKKRTAPF